MKTGIILFSILFISMTGFSQEKSTNKNVIFIHGAWSTGKVWKNYETYFSEQGYNTISPTLSFHSIERNDSLLGMGIEDYLNQIREVVKSFHNKPVVIAHSIGCIIAQRLAMEGLVEKLVLIAPPANFGMMPPSESIKSVKWVNNTKHLASNLTKPTFEEAVNGMLHNLSPEKQKEVYAAMTFESGRVMKEIIWIKNLFGQKPNKIIYSKINVPVLFVSGGKDNASPVKISEKLMKKYKSNSELKVFENNAHWMLEEKNWNEIAEFIKNWSEK
jgi:pimeloyl-ACP methyl ester carboxylesterase